MNCPTACSTWGSTAWPAARRSPALLERYARAAHATEEAVAALADLDVSVPLPKTPWSPPEPQYWSARRILLHLIKETAQHAGHADIIRPSTGRAPRPGADPVGRQT
ncbi:DUF664 domain-containing protein [Streptomyces qaidamensis]|uniref:mycothiol transferase n=1 Tax=Streptomyces qaidamensis TaxID=1783515 RepID=UPI00365394FB